MPIKDAYELSPTQVGMLFHGLDAGTSGVDVEQVVGVLEEAIDEAAFREAWESVVARHPVLRTEFQWEGLSVPRQVVQEQVGLTWTRFDWTEISTEERARRQAAFLENDRRKPFDLRRAPPMRFALAQGSETLWAFIWTFHHSILDGRSFPIVLEDVFSAYEALRRGSQWTPRPRRQFRDYIHWLRSLDLESAEAFWRSELEGFRAPTPVGVGRSQGGTDAGMGSCELRLSEARTTALREFARCNGLTLNTLLQGAWAILLHRYTGEQDVVFGSTRACRRSALGGADDVVGLLINTLPLRVRIDPSAALLPWLARVREQQVRIRPHEHTPLVKVQAWSQVPRGQALFESLVVFDNQSLDVSLRRLGAPWERRHFLYRGQTSYPVTVIGYGDPELHLRLEFDRSRLSDGAGARLLGHLATLMEGMAAAPANAPLASLPLLTAGERAILAPPCSVPSPATRGCLHERFETQAELRPEATAVVCGELSLTYAELNRRANQLAHCLRSLGVGPETLVGLSLERSVDLVVAILGILKAGGAYLPLDPAYPRDRLAFMLEDAGVAVVVTERALSESLPPGPATRVIFEETGSWPGGNPVSGATPANLAYVIYTSGSTGKPKGCLVTHGNVGRLFESTDEWFGFGPADVWTLFHSYAFDFTVWELWGALLYGGRLVVVPYWVSRAPESFLELLQREQVTVLNQTPSAFRQLIQADLAAGGEPGRLALRYVVFGGEALDLQSLRPWFARHGDRRPQLVNMYGITETTVHVTYRPLSQADVEGGAGSVIGVPIPDLYVRVLDPVGEPVPIGVPGEMYVGGAGVARGYLGRPELTAERFVRDPFSNDPTSRLYRSGDLARCLEDGDLEYLGRIDHQVKIRGFRIELGEIEAVLSQHPAVHDAIVLAREGSPGERRLVAYVVASGGDRGPIVEDLRARLKAALPEYMVPSAFVFLDALPLTENGKVDRRALPAPDFTRPERRAPYVAPRTAAEEALARIWGDVLGVERVGAGDNFFELGGDSILSIQVISRARSAGYRLTPREIFKRPILGELAQGLEPAVEVASEGPVEGPVPLTPIQRWFFGLELPEPHYWNQAFLFETPAEPDRLEAALAALARHHDAFRLRFHRRDGAWQQSYAGAVGHLPFDRIDLSALSVEERPAALEAASVALQRRLNLEEGPLARAAFISLGSGRTNRLLLILHHLIVDGVSWRILIEDIERAYHSGPGSADRPAGSSSYGLWGRRLAECGAAGSFRASLPEWQAACAAAIPLPVDEPMGENTEASTQAVVVSLEAEETQALLQRVPAAYRSQINDALLAALGQAVGAWSGRDVVRLDLEGHGREEDLFGGLDLSRTVGWFTSLFPVTLELPRDGGEGAVLKAVKERLRSVPDRGLSFGVLRHVDGEAEALLSSAPPADLLFNYLGQFDQVVAGSTLFAFAPESCGPWHAPSGTRTHLLEVITLVTGGRLEARFLFSRNRHREATIRNLAGSFLKALRSLIDHCCRATGSSGTPSDFPLVRLEQAAVDRLTQAYEVEDILPLAPMQRLFYAMEASHSGLGFEPWRFRLRGALRSEHLRAAWEDVLDRHPILRSAYVSDGVPEPVQVVVRSARPDWREEDWRGLPAVEQERRWRELEATDRERGFDLTRPPLTRLSLARLADDTWDLLWSTHHLHIDGWSWPLVFRDLSAFYEARRTGNPPVLPAACSYGRYLGWLRHFAPSSESFWRETLKGFRGPTLLLPPVDAQDQGDAAPGEEIHCLSADASEALRSLAREEGLTLNSVVLGAWALLLAHWSGDRDVTLGAAFSGRPSEEPGIESMVGPCVANLPVRILVPAEASLGTWMTDLQGAQSEVAQHQYAPLERIQDWAGVPWRMRLFDSLLVFQNYSVDEGARRLGPDVDVEILSSPEATNYPITLTVLPGAELRLRLLYHRSHSSPETARLMMTDLVSLLGAMSRGGAVSLGSLLEQLPARSRSWAAPPVAPRRAVFAAPKSETENRIAAIWAELFQVPQVGLDDNFFDLGGHSVLLVRAHALLSDALGLTLPIVALLQYPTVRSLALFLGGGQRGAARESDTADRARLAREAFARRRNIQGKR